MFIPKLSTLAPALAQCPTPFFVTDQSTLQTQAQKMLSAFSAENNWQVFYALKANFNPQTVKTLRESGIYGIDTVSLNEVQLAKQLGYAPEQIIYTPSNPSSADLEQVTQWGILSNLGSVSEVARFGAAFPGQSFAIRICPEVGAGESAKVTTGGLNSKFGIELKDISTVQQLAQKHGLQLIGIHSHIGSGFYQSAEFLSSVKAVCAVAEQFDQIQFLDFGGGFGVSYHPEKSDPALEAFAPPAEEIIQQYERQTGTTVKRRLEPGKFLVSGATALITQVTTIKEKGGQTFVGVDASMSTYVRPAMYDSYQHFINLSNPDSPRKIVTIVGNACESSDILNHEISLPAPQEGDFLALLVAGGYGSAMSSNYNLRPMAAEFHLQDGKITRTREIQSYEQIMAGFTF